MRKGVGSSHPGRFYRRYQSFILLALFAVLQILMIMIAFLTGYLLREWPYANQFLFQSKFGLMEEAYKIIDENAYHPLPDQKKLEYGMIRGMIQAIDDPYTVFVEPPQHELQTNQLEGRFGGIGVRIERDAENLVYLYPLPNSPALAAGLMDGDRLLSVEDLQITPATTNDELQAAVRGPVGSKVKITIGRAPDFLPLEYEIERAEVALPSMTWNQSPDEPQVGILQIRVIADTTPQEVTNAIQDLQARGATRFILDVRNNGGGLVEAGVNTARLFLNSGIVIQQQYRGQEVKTYEVTEPGQFLDIPLVVLVNKGTASAAEILTGALKGQGRALVVGTPTYGKDSIQLVFRLSDGSSLHVTSAKWWVPGLDPQIGGNGLQPDILIQEDSDPNAAVLAAIEALMK